MITYSLKLLLSSSYQPKHISGNIIPKMQKDMLKHYPNFQCQSILGTNQEVVGYRLTWN